MSRSFLTSRNRKHSQRSFQRGRSRSRHTPLRFETLECRLALSTFLVLNTNNSGGDSLRQAILDANANAGADLIAFNLPAGDPRHFYYQNNGAAGVSLANVAVTAAADDSTIADIDPDYPHSWWSIQPTAGLPTISDAVTIDGSTQPGFVGLPIIELSGASAGSASGLVVTAGDSTVRGLVINRFQFVGGSGLDGKGNGIVISTNGGDVLEGNYIGTDVSGTAGLGNRRWGVLIFAGSSANRIGTNGDGIGDAAERNVISGNGTIGNSSSGAGLIIFGTADNVVAGNYFGTDVTGTVALGNTNRGISVQSGAHGNRIGTDGNGVADAAERNVLSGNLRNGVVIASDVGQPLTYGNTVAGNYIGTNAAGTGPLGNGRFGVNIFGAADGNLIGGVAAALGNSIAFNGEAGVIVLDVATDPVFATGNRIQGNSIHSNVGLGIDLALDPSGANGVTPDDTGDADTGPNNLQNFPLLTVAHSGPQTFVAGTLNSTANTTFTLDFYASAAADPSGYGEGARYLGSQTWATDSAGNASFEVLLNATTSVGEVVTATATEEPTGNTSEFSAAEPVTDLVVNGTFGDEEYSFSAHSIGTVQVLQVSLFGVPLPDGMAAQVFVSDPGGSDTYTVNFGGWDGVVSIDDQGTTVNDNLIVNGTIFDDSLNKQSGFVSWRPLGDTGPYRATVNFSGFGDTGDTVTLIAGSGDDTMHDPGTNTTILGGLGDDTITIDATTGNGVVVDGGDGSDTYVVMFGNLAGPVTVSDSGTTGVDSLEVNGTAGNDALTLAGNEVQNGAERVIVAAPVANLVVNAGDGTDSITVGDFTAPIASLGLDGGAGTNEVTVTGSLPPGVELDVVAATQTVDLNIRRHAVNLNSKGMIAVILYTTPTFNAASVDLGSVLFAGAHVVKSRLRDVDCDGDLDLVLKFRTQDTNLRDVYAELLAEADQTVNGKLDKHISTRQTATQSLTGETVDGLFFEGFDTLDLFLEGKELKQLVHDLAAAGSI